jgi:hypothetical protein
MAFDFCPSESDNHIYAEKINGMTEAEVIQEYTDLLESRRRGGDRDYNLQMCFDIITASAGRRGINLRAAMSAKFSKKIATKEPIIKEEPEMPEASPIPMIKAPESKSIEEYGYDEAKEILYIKFKSGIKTYGYKNVPKDVYEAFKADRHKGKLIPKIRKDYKLM